MGRGTFPFPCPVEGCDYSGGTEKARALHVQNKHPLELKPLPVPPAYQALPGARRAVVYLRVSTIDQNPEAQLPHTMTFLGLRGFELQRDVGHVTDDETGAVRIGGGLYRDRGFSGKNTDRPALKRLIADASTGAFDVVVFRRLSRLGRSLRDNIALWDYFQSLGVALVSVEEPYDTTTPSGRLIRNVMASVAEYQREEMLEQQAEGIALRRASGKIVGRHPTGCGIPREMGGLGPCPEGVTHKGSAGVTEYLLARRKKNAEKKRRQRSRDKERTAQKRNAGTNTVARSTPFPGGDTAPATGA